MTKFLMTLMILLGFTIQAEAACFQTFTLVDGGVPVRINIDFVMAYMQKRAAVSPSTQISMSAGMVYDVRETPDMVSKKIMNCASSTSAAAEMPFVSPEEQKKMQMDPARAKAMNDLKMGKQ